MTPPTNPPLSEEEMETVVTHARQFPNDWHHRIPAGWPARALLALSSERDALREEAAKDIADMLRFQEKFIRADHDALDLEIELSALRSRHERVVEAAQPVWLWWEQFAALTCDLCANCGKSVMCEEHSELSVRLEALRAALQPEEKA